MKFTTTFDLLLEKNACLIVAVYEENQLSPTAQTLDTQSQGAICQLLAQGDFEGKVGQTLLLPQLANLNSRVLLVGCGKQGELNSRQYKQLLQKTAQTLATTKTEIAVCALTEVAVANRSLYWNIRFAAEAFAAQSYVFDQFKSQKGDAPHLNEVRFVVSAAQQNEADTAVQQAQAVSLGVKFAKDLANCPPNICNPHYLAQQAQALAETYSNVQTTVLGEAAMAELGMNSYLAVSRGSANEAFMSIIEYKGAADANAKPIVLVGKGLTFDTGGISIKPAEAMDEMKYDMGGAAAVYGTMKAIAEMQLPLNVIGVLAGCENAVDGNAYRPGDILTTMSGLTVEVLNTDAEGRLVLCDALTYVERFKPELVIDVATLTGACMVALGKHNSGLLSTDDELAQELLASANESEDLAWRLPLSEDYQEQLKSNFADLANIGGRFGGASTAGQFLSNFTKNYRWAHLDVAGTAWNSGAAKGATGRPVGLLSQFLINRAK